MAPFRLVVLGDSVMWGQGLDDASKASTRVQRWLESRLHREVQRVVLAHSGAVIVPDLVRDLDPPTDGEIPNAYPSITYQASRVDAPETVDLVLLNGGINDLHPAEILNPLNAIPNRLARLIRLKCGHMNELLTGTIFPTFNRALVIVSGYFPLVSELSDLAEVFRLGCLFRGLKPILEILGSLSDPLLVQLAAQSREWMTSSNAVLSGTVDNANQLLGALRAQFVPVQFGPENCYAAPHRWLWMAGEDDPARPHRVAACLKATAAGQFTGEPECVVASAFHPNREGEMAYSQAITQTLEPLLSHLGA